MKTLNVKNQNRQQSTSNYKTVSMNVYINLPIYGQRIIGGNFDMETIHEINQLYEESVIRDPEYRDFLFSQIVVESSSFKLDHELHKMCLRHVITDNDIQQKIREYPDGGYGIIGYYNCNDQSDQEYQFLNPEEFQKRLNDDYKVIPFNGKNVGITIDEDEIICDQMHEELFLSCLIELMEDSDNLSCNYSNEEIAMRMPEPLRDSNLISKLLGKFKSLGLIEVLTYDIDGAVWHRDIFQTMESEDIEYPG